MLWIPGIICGCFFGFWLYSFVGALAHLLIGPMTGYRIVQVSLFGFNILCTDGKCKACMGEFSWLPEVVLEVKKTSYGKRTMLNVMTLVFGGALEAGLFFYLSSFDGYKWHVCAGTMILLAVFLLWHLGMLIKDTANMFGKGEGAVFWRENDRVVQQVRQGVHPKDLQFHYEISEENCFKDVSHMQYDLLRYYKALEEDDRDAMDTYIMQMRPYIQMDWSIVQTPIYYELVYYLAKYERDMAETETYAARIRNVMEKDKDVNGRRVYAAYLFYSGKDKRLAMQVAKEGLKAVEKYRMKGVAYMERNLLTELIREMEEVKYGHDF